MGLDQASILSHDMFRKWRLPAVILLTSLIFELAGASGRVALRYDHVGIEAFEFWRLLTGHLVHLGWTHLALNAAGLVLIWTLVGGSFSQGHWIAILLVSIAGIDTGLWLLDPDLAWYVGFSGALHGMLAAGIVAQTRTGSMEAVVLGLVLVVKITWEQLMGPLPGSAAVAGGNVLVNAHLYGAVAGGLAGLALIRARLQRPI